ncbi:hypothetical protein WICPIJ_009185 [Wickerhamomyces pijperi]|uniref:protein-serine/threonine phosphatase n=1 Tax=Wickerhamomyces pijperi TaxID=599730 RepID=A0A9P8PRB1_WICPI|nr:hypothetical protein WICPIJ_009185 [Wickerhamomyces pijperi]
MGQILSQPVTTKHSDSDKNKYLAYGLSSMQGWRINMEDAHTTILNLDTDSDEEPTKAPTAFFAVYDGHGGENVAKFTGDNLFRIVKNQKEYSTGDFNLALKNAFLAADREILEHETLKNDQSGCTATTVLVNDKKIVCANAGDSRTVLSVNGYAKALSFDHKPNNEGEHARICAAGGFVDMGRVNGNLALSRAIGDFDFKKSAKLPAEEQIVTAFPDVIEHEITSDDEFIVLACDGIWDCLTSQQVVEVVRKGIHDGLSLTEIAEGMIDICLAPTSGGSGIGCDNMSLVIVALLNGKTEEEWYQSIVDKKGPVSKSFEEVANEIYSEEERAQSFENRSQSATSAGAANGEEGEFDAPYDASALLNGNEALQELLMNKVISSQNGVFYLDTSNIASTLKGLGQELSEDSEEPVQQAEEVEEESEEDKTEASITEAQEEKEEK